MSRPDPIEVLGDWQVIQMSPYRVTLYSKDYRCPGPVAEVIGNEEDFRRTHGNIERWLKKIKRRESKRLEKIEFTLSDLLKEKEQRQKVLDGVNRVL